MKKNLRVLFVTRSFPPVRGGMENFAHELYVALSDRTECRLIANRGRFVSLVYFALRAAFYSLLMGWKYDVFYCNDMLTSFFLIPAKWLYGKRLVVTVYGLDVNFMFRKPRSALNKAVVGTYKRVLGITRKYIDHYVPISDGTAGLLKAINVENYSVITPGVWESRISRTHSEKQLAGMELRRKLGVSEDKRIILHIGRIVRRKGLLWFVREVFPHLSAGYHLIVVGEGPDLSAVSGEVAGKGLNGSVTLLGAVSNDERDAALLGSDVFIMPNISIHAEWEGFGLVAVEASSNGTPVIAAKIEGITSAVVQGETGFFFESEDPSDCVAAFKSFEEAGLDPAAISRVTLERYDWKRIANQYLSVLGEQ